MNKIRNKLSLFLVFSFIVFPVFSQSNPDDYWLGNGFTSGQTITTNSGFFYDDGGFDLYNPGQNWNVRFCSENGNPITVDFSGFRTYYPGGPYGDGDYILIQQPGFQDLVAYSTNTPQFSFTSPSGCISFSFFSKAEGVSIPDSGWVAEISANPPPPNNDPCEAAELSVGNVCSPEFFSNKGSWDTRGIGDTDCHEFFGGDVWFSAVVPDSGNLKVETIAGSLEYAIMTLYRGSCGSLTEYRCVDIPETMPVYTFSGLTPGETVYIRIFGNQAKSGTFGICATDPTAQVQGFTGPGGVGDEVSNRLWLKADTGVLNSGGSSAGDAESVQQWIDQSGNTNDVTQAVSASQPVFDSNGLNAYPALNFDGNQAFMTLNSENISAPVDIFTVHDFAVSQDHTLLAIGDADDNSTLSIGRENTTDEYYTFSGGIKHYGDVLPSEAQILFSQYIIEAPFHSYFLNGNSQTVTYTGGMVSTNGNLFLGSDKNQLSFFNGKVAEVIIYTKLLNQAQEIIVSNYLSTKYDISIPQDFYSFETTHKYDLAGIGRISEGNTHTKAQSAGILAIGGASNLDDNEFVLFAHDNAGLDSWVSEEIPGTDLEALRLESEWKVDITGDGPGSVTISLDTLAIPELPEGYSTINIAVDEDGDFTSGSVYYGLVPSNDELVANGVEISDGSHIAIFTILPEISFVEPASSGPESVERPEIDIELSYGVSEPVRIGYSVTGGTAANDEDFSLNDDEILFNPGETLKTITPLIFQDSIVEVPFESFTITLEILEGEVLPGEFMEHVYTIIDDDISVTAQATDTTIGACDSSTTVLTAVATGVEPISYSWSPTIGLTNPNTASTVANPENDIEYIITATDAEGKIARDTIEIFVQSVALKPAVDYNPGENVFCEGDSVVLTGPDGFNYLWSNGQTTQSITVKEAGKYALSVFDEYCSSPTSDSVEVFVNSLPDTPVITPEGPISVYSGDVVELTATESDNYFWSTGETTSRINVTETGDYSVRAISDEGCESPFSSPVSVTVSDKIPAPEIIVTGDTDICEGESVILSTSSAAAYLWSTGEATQSIVVSEAGSYFVQIENADGVQSEISDPVSVQVVDSPSVSETVQDVSCFNGSDGSINITTSGGQAPYSYSWNTGSSETGLSDIPAGTYRVEVTDANECSSSLDISVGQPEIITIEAESTPVSCPGFTDASVTLEVSGGTEPYQFEWSNGNTGNPLVSVGSGNYSVNVTDANNCVQSLEVTVVEIEAMSVSATITNARCPDAADGEISVSVTGGTSPYFFTWDDGSAGSERYDLTEGNYNVTVSDANGCEMAREFALQSVNDVCFRIPDIITPNGDGKNDVWVIEGLEIYPDVEVEIFDRWGKRVFYSRGYDENFRGEFNGKELPMESYHYVIDLNNGTSEIIGNITIVR